MYKKHPRGELVNALREPTWRTGAWESNPNTFDFKFDLDLKLCYNYYRKKERKMIIMNKFIKELVQIGYELMENNPNFDKIDKKLTQIEKEMNEN